MTIQIAANDYNGKPQYVNVQDVLTGPFFIATEVCDGLYTPIAFFGVNTEDSDFEDQYDDWCDSL